MSDAVAHTGTRPPVAPPPMYSVTAATLADMRHRCWCQPQLTLLDMLIDALSNEYELINPRFDEERFHYQANYQYR